MQSPAACGNGEKCVGHVLVDKQLVFAIMHRCETCRVNGRENPTFLCALCTAASCTVEGSTHASCSQCIDEGVEGGFMGGPVDARATNDLMHFIFTDEERCREFISLTFLWRMMMWDKKQNLGKFFARVRTGQMERVFTSIFMAMVEKKKELGGSSAKYSADEEEAGVYLQKFFADEVIVVEDDHFVRDPYAAMPSPEREEVAIDDLEESLKGAVLAFARSAEPMVTLQSTSGFTFTLRMLDAGKGQMVVEHCPLLWDEKSYFDPNTGDCMEACPGAVEGEDDFLKAMRVFVMSGAENLLLDDEWGFEGSFTLRVTADGCKVVQHFFNYFPDEEGASTFYDALTLERLDDSIEASLLSRGRVKRKADSFPVDNDREPMTLQEYQARVGGSKEMPWNV